MKSAIAIVILAVALVLYPPLRGTAQVNQGEYGLFQNGIKVGEIYVPERAADDDLYIEHWALYPEYRSPDVRSGITVELRPVDSVDASADAFFQRISAVEGVRYVKVVAHEMAQLPCF